MPTWNMLANSNQSDYVNSNSTREHHKKLPKSSWLPFGEIVETTTGSDFLSKEESIFSHIHVWCHFGGYDCNSFSSLSVLDGSANKFQQLKTMNWLGGLTFTWNQMELMQVRSSANTDWTQGLVKGEKNFDHNIDLPEKQEKSWTRYPQPSKTSKYMNS